MKNSKSLKFVLILSVFLLLSMPAFAQVDVPRQTTAMTYPQDEVVNVQFRGTTRFPRMKGDAKIKRTSKNGTEIELSVSKMPRPFELGAGYATYVLWAISPDGQIDNLGEIKRRGFWEFDSKISVTTPLQTFALIITAEPHFLVHRPSRAIMLENLNSTTQSGRILATTKAVQYFGNASDYFNDAHTPEIAETDYAKTPSAVLQARQAIALAQYAGAGRDATEDLQKAQSLFESADNGWKAGRAEADVDTTARQAISAAVKAEDTAAIRREAREKRNEKSRQDAEIQKVEDRVTDAQNELLEVRDELSREQRRRELAERDAANYSAQIKQLRDENAQLREELGQVRSDAEAAKIKAARLEGEKNVSEQQRQDDQKQRDEQQRIDRARANMPILMQTLRSYGTVRQSERGIILTLPDTFWNGVRVSDLAPASGIKLSGLANLLTNNPDYKIFVESHVDGKGTPEELQALTDTRAQVIMDRLTSNGVDQTRVQAKGMGAMIPIAPNTTLANRAKNRRVEIILTPTF